MKSAQVKVKFVSEVVIPLKIKGISNDELQNYTGEDLELKILKEINIKDISAIAQWHIEEIDKRQN